MNEAIFFRILWIADLRMTKTEERSLTDTGGVSKIIAGDSIS